MHKALVTSCSSHCHRNAVKDFTSQFSTAIILIQYYSKSATVFYKTFSE